MKNHPWEKQFNKTRMNPKSKKGRGKVDPDEYADAIIKQIEMKEKRMRERREYE